MGYFENMIYFFVGFFVGYGVAGVFCSMEMIEMLKTLNKGE